MNPHRSAQRRVRPLLAGLFATGSMLGGLLAQAVERDPEPLVGPLPLPIATARASTDTHWDFAIEHDLTTGETRRVAVPPAAQWRERAHTPSLDGPGGTTASIPPEIASTGPAGLDGFTQAYALANAGSHPFRMNCRLEVTWPVGTGFGSAALVDPYHVITAGHAVIDNRTGNVFPTALRVAPGYDRGSAPYGWAEAVSFLVLPGWLFYRDLEQDIAIVRLDRPVGALTGHFGMGVDTDNGFYRSRQFYNYGYPAESPFTSGQLYGRSGSFDSCPSATEARFDQPSVGGQSGSAFYTFLGAQRIVFAAMSHGRNDIVYRYSDAVRFSPSTFATATSYIESLRPPIPDLVPLDIQESVPYAARGSWVRGSDLLIHNHSETAFSGSLVGWVYLSRNREITGDDIYVGYLWSSTSIPAMGSRRLPFDFYVNPASLPRGGLYYVGVELATGDGNRANNTTGRHDVGQIIVY